MPRILAVDDDPDMLALVRTCLIRDGHSVDTQQDPTQITPEKCRLYDLILLDVMMPGEDGFAFCRRIRGEVDCPILFLTAKVQESALVRGLGLGADDYIKKPFGVAELRARVNAHLRRDTRQPSHTLSRGGVRFDLLAQEAFCGEQKIPFTKSEYILCEHLSEHVGQVFTKEQLYEAAFGYDGEGDASAVAEHIKNIRAKLKSHGLSPIETVWGVGYKWTKESGQ